MANARHRIWHRAGPVIAMGTLLTALTASGCDGSETTTNNTGGTNTTTTNNTGGEGGTTATGGGGAGGTTVTTGMGGTGGTGGGPGGFGGGTGQAAATDVGSPLDATPDPDNTNIYFTALDSTKGAGVYKVAVAGGASTALSVGDPFVAPFGIAIATDGSQLFVADPASAVDATDAGDSGQIFAVATDGGAPTPLSGSQGLRPRSLETHEVRGADFVYFTGRDQNGPNVFTVPAAGGTATALLASPQLTDPSGIAVAANGDVYVIDAVARGANVGRVMVIKGGDDMAVELLTEIVIGYPAGVALSLDDSRLLVSGFNPATLTDAVVIINLVANVQTLFTGGGGLDLTKFEESAGLHRAKGKDSFAWADSKAVAAGGQTTAGTVFSINF